MRNKTSAYWLCQVLGWSCYYFAWIVVYFSIRTEPTPLFHELQLADCLIGFLFSHGMRTIILRGKIMDQPLVRQILLLFLLTVATAFIYSFFSNIITEFLYRANGLIDSKWGRFLKEYSLLNRTIRFSPQLLFLLLVWNFIYFSYHYIESNRSQQLEKVKLETLVKELELKTIKAHINPHFIFNALNSIRALVDENPERARTAITELSNILRSSMQAEKVETTTLAKELNIVKDYLALEHIRFEDRLQIEFDIDEDTLGQQVPPMMLQTLVENAIKHGISKQMEGGTVKIISDFVQDHHELVVENTGRLSTDVNQDGFGLSSTRNRLNLLYGSKASFEIKDVNGNKVQARVDIPLNS
jgi:two-component system LytT family sensor kinase